MLFRSLISSSLFTKIHSARFLQRTSHRSVAEGLPPTRLCRVPNHQHDRSARQNLAQRLLRRYTAPRAKLRFAPQGTYPPTRPQCKVLTEPCTTTAQRSFQLRFTRSPSGFAHGPYVLAQLCCFAAAKLCSSQVRAWALLLRSSKAQLEQAPKALWALGLFARKGFAFSCRGALCAAPCRSSTKCDSQRSFASLLVCTLCSAKRAKEHSFAVRRRTGALSRERAPVLLSTKSASHFSCRGRQLKLPDVVRGSLVKGAPSLLQTKDPRGCFDNKEQVGEH